MTLNAKIWDFMDFWQFWAVTQILRVNSPKPIEINIEKLHIKFLSLNIDFNGPSLVFLGSTNLAHESIKEHYPCKSHYFTFVG